MRLLFAFLVCALVGVDVADDATKKDLAKFQGNWTLISIKRDGKKTPHEDYESAFSVRWLIQDQIKGEANLNHDPKKGKVVAPILLWGPYFWADGITPRKTPEILVEIEADALVQE